MSGTTITETQTIQPQAPPRRQYKWNYIWKNIILYMLMHFTGLYGLYLCLSAPWKTIFFSWFLLVLALQGVTAGSHRHWAHKTFKATFPLKCLLVILQTLSLQNHAYDWATYHRAHHKYVDTEADPHNSRRGLFFSHVGWLFVEPEPEVEQKYKGLDFSDLHADTVLMFQKKHYQTFFAPVIGIGIPMLIPWYFWGDTITNGFFIACMLRYCLCTNITFLVNSYAHAYGTKPYDKSINPTEIPIVSLLTGGEGWHNYHHVFPWDYKAGEWGYKLNLTTAFLDWMAAIGWAYDLKAASSDMILNRVRRTGDGTRKVDKLFSPNTGDDHNHGDDHVWGWGDKDMTEEDFSYVKVHNSKTD